jgi:hypothetical protein
MCFFLDACAWLSTERWIWPRLKPSMLRLVAECGEEFIYAKSRETYALTHMSYYIGCNKVSQLGDCRVQYNCHGPARSNWNWNRLQHLLWMALLRRSHIVAYHDHVVSSHDGLWHQSAGRDCLSLCLHHGGGSLRRDELRGCEDSRISRRMVHWFQRRYRGRRK